MTKLQDLPLEADAAAPSQTNSKPPPAHIEHTSKLSEPTDEYPITTHPNTIPPTEFMALGLYEHEG